MLPTLPSSRPPRGLLLILLLVVLFIASRSIASLILDYHWWNELGQIDTWYRMWIYRWAPAVFQWLILAIVLWWAHARGMKYAGTGLREHPGYARIATIAAFVISLFLAAAAVDGWTVARYWGGQGVSSTWRDPVFNESLAFYFFQLPFYESLATFLAVCAAAAAIVYYATARFWQLRLRFPELWRRGQIEWNDIKRLGDLESGIFKTLIALFLIGLAIYFWLGRYDMLYTSHGDLMTGLDYVQQNVGLPLQTLKVAAALLAAVLVVIGKRKWAIACAAVLIADIFIPPVVSSLYVRPNELALERPYLERHIEATRSAYGITQHSKDVAFPARKGAPIDFAANSTLLDNVRLWDWQAFHDTLSQSQPLRPYAYADTDVDRYQIGGQMRQVLLAPRELDLGQLGDAQRRWVISHTIYTHGYGLVLAEANRITSTGSPELLIRDAPLEITAPGLKVARPEIYYGEKSQDPVFVRTSQPEFNFPSGSEDISTRYDGRGGFPISSLPLRLAAAWADGDWNIVLSDAFTNESRMMMRRDVTGRLRELAPFLEWDRDPYLVINDDGRLVWMVDGYTLTDRHPYARGVNFGSYGEFNYIRNSIKATIDAYNGDVHMFVFDPEDPLIQGYSHLFPALFKPASEMPAGLRAHARYPELLFTVQAEIYRIYHMRVPESFYNRADSWDLATYSTARDQAQPVPPSYIIATLPGETKPEFLLTLPFTPKNKQNLIGFMAARCDGAHLGEIVFLQFPKQEILSGPLQIEALINQDSVISKDISLWNQQHSQVLRGQILVLPIGNTLMYVDPIYIQAEQARMPQLERVAIVSGDILVYADTYPQALEMLAARQRGARPVLSTTTSTTGEPSQTPTSGAQNDPRIAQIRDHLEKYRSLTSQGKLSEAGKELEAVESLTK